MEDKKDMIVYLMIDNAIETKNKILLGESPEYSLYGGIEMEKEGKVIIKDYTLKNILKCKRGDIIITNRTKHIILIKSLGIKIILINMNSNHDLTLCSGIKSKLLNIMYKIYYRLCDIVICVSKVQLNKLESIGIKNIKVIPLGVNLKSFKTKTKSNYLLSAGFDKGRNFDYIKNTLKGFNIKILNEKNKLPYNEYIKVVGKAKAMVFNIDTNKKNSSDISGTMTCVESLLMETPIIINYQSWLKELFKENYYVYKNEKELKELCKRKLKFKKINYDYLTLDYFTKELNNIIKNIS